MTTTTTRFAALQQNRTLVHPTLPQPDQDSENEPADKDINHHDSDDESSLSSSSSFTFIVTADTQFGMARNNINWDNEMAASRAAVQQINRLRPLFCCICGDLVHMTADIYANKNNNNNNKEEGRSFVLSAQECNDIQDKQNKDFQRIWSEINDDIPLVCLCGNHDVGNRPTAASIDRFRNLYGDDYLAFWARRSYNIVLNTSLLSDATAAPDLLDEQITWLEERLQYANQRQASHIFVFGHHPFFLYDEHETELPGGSPLDEFGIPGSIGDDYFVIPLAMRQRVLRLFRLYNVTAAFAGHFHQNMVSTTSFGMPMITTSALSVVLKSTGIPVDFDEPKTRGMRIVTVHSNKKGSFDHRFVELEE